MELIRNAHGDVIGAEENGYFIDKRRDESESEFETIARIFFENKTRLEHAKENPQKAG